MSRICLAVVCTHLLLAPIAAGELPRVPPADVGLSAERLETYRRSLEDDVARRQLAGAVVLVMRQGKVGLLEAVGQRDAENDRPMTTDTVFRIASMSKPVTSVAIMQLVEQGRLALEDPLSRFIPEFRNPRVLKAPIPKQGPVVTVRATRDITIADLLTHTSGIVYKFAAPEPLHSLYTEANVSDGLVGAHSTIGENAARIGQLPLLHQPGEQWTYGLSTDVLGRVVEVASGQPLNEYLRDHIFKPLAMIDTGFELPVEKADRLAALYHADEQGRFVRTGEERSEGQVTYSPDYPLRRPQTYFSGGAGLVSTAMDYARFCQMLLNRGELHGARVLKPETVDLMTQNHIGELEILYQIHGDKFGYGFGITSDTLASIDVFSAGTYSWGGLYYTFFWVDPQEDLIGILMAQKFPYGQLTAREQFKQAVYEAIDEPAGSVSATRAPQPGDTYREYAVHNGGNLDWRVTDPDATAAGAQQFLPNPVIEVSIDTLDGATGAELLLDRWGGHPRTTAKQVRINGGEWLAVPELTTTPDGHRPELYYSQDNPIIDVPLSMLQVGTNTIEGRCSALDDYNWGQWGLYSAIIRVHQEAAPDTAGLRISAPANGETLTENPAIRIDTDGVAAKRVDVIAWYNGFDENGDGVFQDWHRSYLQPQRGQPADISQHVGTAVEPPFTVTWETTWIPDQPEGGIRLIARVQTDDGVWHLTPIVEGLSLQRSKRSVRLYVCRDVPEQFGVRVGQTKSCTFEIPESDDLSHAVAARLHLRTWHGLAEAHEWLKFNDRSIPLAGNNHHYDHDLLDVPADVLVGGRNTLAIHSKTEHHMLEVLWPGPGLLVEYRR